MKIRPTQKRGNQRPVAEETVRKLTIEISEDTVDALEYYRLVYGVSSEILARDLVEYCLADSFSQGIGCDVMEHFAEDAAKLEDAARRGGGERHRCWRSYHRALKHLRIGKRRVAKIKAGKLEAAA